MSFKNQETAFDRTDNKSDSTSLSQSRGGGKKSLIVQLVNKLLQICTQLHKPLKYPQPCIPTEINLLSELKPNFYIYFYENICGSEVIDKKWPAVTIDDHIHNTQAVIDSLSLDVLHEDLSYLTGEAVCKPHFTSVKYLLEILHSVHEWIQAAKIDKTASNSEKSLDSKDCAQVEMVKKFFV